MKLTSEQYERLAILAELFDVKTSPTEWSPEYLAEIVDRAIKNKMKTFYHPNICYHDLNQLYRLAGQDNHPIFNIVCADLLFGPSGPVGPKLAKE